MAGISCARALHERGWRVRVFDKARGVGGRMSTRRLTPWHFDHGAPAFEAQDPLFRQALGRWAREGFVRPWHARLAKVDAEGDIQEAEDENLWVGIPRMSALVRSLASGLEIEYEQRITALVRQQEQWYLDTAEGERRGPYDIVVSAIPAEQAEALLRGTSELAERVATQSLVPCFALLLGYEGSLDLEWDGVKYQAHPLLSRAYRNSAKPLRPAEEAWVLYANAAWSAEHEESNPERLGPLLLESFAASLRLQLPTPAYLSLHRWRFSQATQALGPSCLFDYEQNLGVCGDWCLGSGVESAFLSGSAMAQQLVSD